MNIIKANIVDGGVAIGDYVVPVERGILDKATTGRVLLGVRPESLPITGGGLQLSVDLVEHLGADNLVYGTLQDCDGMNVSVVARGHQTPGLGSTIHVQPQTTYVFDVAGDQPRLF